MKRVSSKTLDGIFVPTKLLDDQRLKAADKLLLGIIPFYPVDEDNIRHLSASRISRFLSLTDKSAARSIERLERAGYLEIRGKAEGAGGGFKVFLKRSSLVALMLASLGSSPTLHKLFSSDSGDELRSALHNDMYYMTKRRRGRRERRVTASHRKKSHTKRRTRGWWERNRAMCSHPLGQLQPGLTSAAVGSSC